MNIMLNLIHSGQSETLKEGAGINASSKPVIHSGKSETLKERAGINPSSKTCKIIRESVSNF